MIWETVIGLETHVELATKTKIFCSCTTEFGGAPNTHCCPVCTGMPGTLPVLNKRVLEFAVKAGLALNCSITRRWRVSGVSSGRISTAFWRMMAPPSGISLTKWTVAPVTLTPYSSAA